MDCLIQNGNMKAIETDGQIKVFNEIPADWKNYLNFREAGNQVHQQEGFFDLVAPAYDTTHQRLGEIYFDAEGRVFTYRVIDKTAQEMALEKEAALSNIEKKIDISALKKLLVILTRSILDNPSITTGELSALKTVYPQYRTGRWYEANKDVFVYEGNLYKVILEHKSQADWLPNEAVSLYTRYVPADETTPWVLPINAETAYALEARVTHNGKTWKSTTPANVWEPGVYGWDQMD